MAEFLPKSQVQVGSAPQHRVSNLGNDLMNLFGAIGKTAQTYNVIGAEAAKVDFADKARTYNEELARWKQDAVGKENDNEFFRAYDERISQISAEIVADSDKYKNHTEAYDTYNALSSDYALNINMQLRPQVQSDELKAIRTNYTAKSNATLQLAKESGIPITKAEVTSITSGAKNFGIEHTQFANTALNSDLDNALERLQSNPPKFSEDFKLQVGGRFDNGAMKNVVDTLFSAYATYGKDGTLIPVADYVTTEHLEKISAFLTRLRSNFADDKGGARNFFWESIYGEQTKSVDALRSGKVLPSEYTTIRDEAVKNFIDNRPTMSNSQVNKGLDQVYDIQRAAAVGTKLQGMISNPPDRVAIKDLLAKGGVIDVEVADPFDGSKPSVTVRSTVTSEQVKNMINHTMKRYEDGMYQEDGSINKTSLANVINLQTQYGLRSQLLDDAATNVLNVSSAPIGTEKDVMNQLDIIEVAIGKNITFDNMNKELPARDYIRNLRKQYERVFAAKKGTDKSVTAKELSDAKRLAATTNAKITVTSFVASNINEVFNEVSKDISFMNKTFGLGDATLPSKDNVQTMLHRWSQNNATSLSGKPDIEDFKLFMKDNMVEFAKRDFANILPFGESSRKNFYVPNVYNKAGVRATDYQIKKAIEKKLGGSGYNNLADDKLVINMRDIDGQTSIFISYRDSKNRMTKVLDPIPADEVFKNPEKMPLF